MIKIFFGQVKVLIWFQHVTVWREVADGLSCSHLVKSLLLLLLCSTSYFQDEVRNVRNNFLLLIHNFDQVSEILQHLQNTSDKGSLVLCVCKTYSGHWYSPQIILKQILKLCNWPGPGEWPWNSLNPSRAFQQEKCPHKKQQTAFQRQYPDMKTDIDNVLHDGTAWYREKHVVTAFTVKGV